MRRTCRGWLWAIALVALVAPSVEAGVVDDAPEAADYTLIYELPIPDTAGFNGTAVPYATDLVATVDFNFDRVAYHLELQRPGEERIFVYVSLPTPVLTAQQTGIPHAGTGVFLQSLVEDLHVVSNHPDLAGLSTVDTGSIEFWASNYGPANSTAVPGASEDLYDTGDQPLGGAGYGSMQIHDYGLGQTLFAYSAWGPGNATSDLGIGNNPDGHPDWTFTGNAGDYTLKNLRVLVRPGEAPGGLSATMFSPQPHQVVQRRKEDVGTLPVAGTLQVPCDFIEGRLVPLGIDGADEGTPTAWEVVIDAPSGSSFYGHMEAPSGWYRLELKLYAEGAALDTVTVEPLGIGEVFITAGQSNSANHGDTPITPTDPRVSAWGTGGWQHGADPQPIATGAGGSPWPPLGDLLAQRFGVPVGFISVGWGGTSVDQWRPYGNGDFPLYDRLLLALDTVGYEGARAILWHQGESDAASGTTAQDYASQLQEVIDATRADAGWHIPWGVALAAWLPGLQTEAIQSVLDGQQAVIDADPLTFQGPTTEDLLGPDWRWDNVHFNHAGLLEHAARWDAKIALPPCQGFIEGEDCEEPPVTEPTPEPEPDAGTAEDSAVQRDAPTHQETSPEVGPEDPEDTDAKALDAPGVEEGAAPTSNKSSGCSGGTTGSNPALPLSLLLSLMFLGVLALRIGHIAP